MRYAGGSAGGGRGSSRFGGSRRKGAELLRRTAVAGLVVAAAVFAVQGGEYGTTDLVKQRASRAQLEGDVAALTQVVDSLEALRDAIADDPWVQEQLAREQFGMVRPGELLYRLDPPTGDATRAR